MGSDLFEIENRNQSEAHSRRFILLSFSSGRSAGSPDKAKSWRVHP